MGTKKPSDATNDIGEESHTEVSNKASSHAPNPEHTVGKNKQQKI